MRGGIELDFYDTSRNYQWFCTNGFNVRGSNGWAYDGAIMPYVAMDKNYATYWLPSAAEERGLLALPVAAGRPRALHDPG